MLHSLTVLLKQHPTISPKNPKTKNENNKFKTKSYRKSVDQFQFLTKITLSVLKTNFPSELEKINFKAQRIVQR